MQDEEKRHHSTFLLWAMDSVELVGGIWRRLYSKEVAGRGPGPRRRGGAAVVAQPRTGEAGSRAQGEYNLMPA
jgi:hypothetical protein